MTQENSQPATPELLPCPFCGGQAKLFDEAGPCIVECQQCNAASGRAPYPSKAVKFWNTRAGEKRKALTPSPLVWTKDKPTEAKWYWMRRWQLVGVRKFAFEDGRFRMTGFWGDAVENMPEDAEWAGPIPEPGATPVLTPSPLREAVARQMYKDHCIGSWDAEPEWFKVNFYEKVDKILALLPVPPPSSPQGADTRQEWADLVNKFEASIIAHQSIIMNGHEKPQLYKTIENLRSIIINSYDCNKGET